MKRFVWFWPAGAADKRSRGFTLIELLVVVAILSLLAGILFPVFSRARENGRRASCMSNLKQHGLSMRMYLQDNDEYYPPKPPSDSDGSDGWANSLNVVVDAGLFQCPSHEDNAGGTDYWLNGSLHGLAEGQITFPANVILFGDGEEGPPDYILGPTPDAAYDNWEPDKPYATRHLDGSNFAFTDGHVKWLHPNSVSTTAPPTSSNVTFVPSS